MVKAEKRCIFFMRTNVRKLDIKKIVISISSQPHSTSLLGRAMQTAFYANCTIHETTYVGLDKAEKIFGFMVRNSKNDKTLY